MVIILAFFSLMFVLGLSLLDKKNKSATVYAAVILFVMGFVMYGIGFSSKEINPFIAAMKTTIATIKMFAGDNQIDKISECWLFQNTFVLVLFEFIHFFALAMTARAIVTLLRNGIVYRIRLWKVRRGNLAIIYGVNDATLEFGRSLTRDGKASVVYVDNKLDSEYREYVLTNTDGILMMDETAMEVSEQFLRLIGAYKKNRQIYLYALDEVESSNITYVKVFDKQLRELKHITKAQMSLTLLANMEMDYGKLFQAGIEDEFGFGSVLTVDHPTLTARQLICSFPPSDYVSFDYTKGVATCDFHALIIGFGKYGQAVLRELIMNGQFEGSHFKATIYDPNIDTISGEVRGAYASMFENIDIEFRNIDARSVKFYNELSEKQDINYIAVCTSNIRLNDEISSEIQAYLMRENRDVNVFRCSRDSVCHHDVKVGTYNKVDVFTRENLSIAYADMKAMVLNYIYCSPDVNTDEREPISYWVEAGYMDKMSSRASAEFNKSFCKMIGYTEEDVLNLEKLDLSAEQIENLAKTEHLRWNAFHWAYGYRPMPNEVWNERCNQYKKEVAEKGSSRLKIPKDDVNRLHACLIPWDELDELTDKYNAVTGKNIDYKQMDRNNVLMMQTLLRICQKYTMKGSKL